MVYDRSESEEFLERVVRELGIRDEVSRSIRIIRVTW